MKKRIAYLMAFIAVGVAICAALGATSAATSGDISPLQTIVRGQTRWLAGGPASLRIIVTNHDTGEPVVGAAHIAITPTNQQAIGRINLYSGPLENGTLEAQFTVPDLNPGAYELSVRVVSRLGIDDVKSSVTIARETRILLTADKPLYQPGQTMHLRALALRRPTMAPAAGEPITLEVEDAKGNKVFKKAIEASKFGIVSAEFTLADEINMGRYTIRAVTEDGAAERTVEVKRYVLPKFKVSLTTDRSYYLPGETLTGKVQCDYFFGKPTSGADVLITVSTFDVAFTEVAEIVGETDENGTFRLETELPDYFVGQPLEQGKAFVKLDVEVTDKADHTEKVTEMVPIAKDPLVITVVPESGQVKPGVDNIIYILVARPDGTPVSTGFKPSFLTHDTIAAPPAPLGSGAKWIAPASGDAFRTDEMGIGEILLNAAICDAKVLRGLAISVANPRARSKVVRSVDLPVESAEHSLLLRASHALAKVGDAVEFTVISTKQRGTTYVDVIRDNQTVLTRAIDLKGGRSEFELPLTPDIQGTLEVHAYQILPDENIIRDTRLLYVEPADDLVVEVRPNQDTYRPGDPAELNFAVRDQQGRATLAALGVTIVDESVFALQEMQPGLERIYFALERELLTPRYEIHGFTTEGIIRGKLPFEKPEPAEGEALRQRAAAVLFAASQTRDPYTLNVNTYYTRLEEAMVAWIKEIARDAEKIDRALRQYERKHGHHLGPEEEISVLVDEGLLKKSDLRDRWNNPYKVRWRQANCWLESAGPDGKWDTKDDIRGVRQWMREGELRRRPMLGMARAAGRGGVAGPDLVFEEGMAMDRADFKAAAVPSAAPAEAGQPQVRLRQFFPETMYVNPAVITDERGRASVTVQMADSITTWRMQTLASSQRGQLGSATTGLRVFQDFFIDIDLPVALTQNDEISIPIAVYNYLPESQTVKLSLELEPWFELVGDEAEKSLDIAASDIHPVYYRIRAKGIGNHSLTVHARGSRLSDAIKRSIDVLPDGEERRDTWNDRLEGTVERQVTIPKQAIPDASTILVKIYPGLFSQAVEGLDALLRMPFGCFEQTSSVTYPNILVLDYLKSTKQAKPELQMKAEQYINVGYQRLLSFEVEGGGFSWFGNPPAHKVLTAYGLLEFSDMSRVHEVDLNVISRTQHWLAGLQQKDGTWERDQGGIAEGIINRQTDTLRVTAYIAWALAESGYPGDSVERALGYLDKHWREAKDPYALAVIANAYLSGGGMADLGHTYLTDTTREVLAELAKMATVEDNIAYWKSAGPTFTSAQDGSADLETTALATYALVKSGRNVDLTNKAITYLIQSKDSFGTWQTTQATVWSLKALLLSLRKAAEEVDGTVTVSVNGTEAGSFRITQADYEVVRQVDAKNLVRVGENDVRITLKGKGAALYQIVSKYYLPWAMVQPPPDELLTIDVSYDRKLLATNDVITATVRVVNNDPRDANMVVIDLGLPPGFALMTEDLDKLVEGGTIEKYSVAARQIIVYLDRLASRKPLEFSYRLRAKFPVKAATPASRVYRYYNPEIEATAEPVALEVR